MTYLLKSFQGRDLEKLTEKVNTFINSPEMKGKMLDGWLENTTYLTNNEQILYVIMISYYDEIEENKQNNFYVDKGVAYAK
jgi:hypothetical protein